MPVTTRRQASSKANANKKTEKKANKKTDRDMVESDVDSWDIPATNLRSSVIKTYSRKQPFRTYWTSSPKNAKSKNTKDSPGMSSKATCNNLHLFALIVKFVLLQNKVNTQLLIAVKAHFFILFQKPHKVLVNLKTQN